MDMVRTLPKHIKEHRKDPDKVNPSRKKVTRNGMVATHTNTCTQYISLYMLKQKKNFP